MSNEKSILMSGGSGLLGQALQSLQPGLIMPSHQAMDVCSPTSLTEALHEHKPDIFLHLAAFTSPPKIDQEPMRALETNIVGTANVVRACAETGTRLVYVSTDYVFKGDTGMYTEDDELLPQNKYAWSKLGGECAVKLYDNSLIIRTTFAPNEFPYDKAFVDQYTSRDTVNVIAPLILQLTESENTGTIHVGTERKTVFEFAKSLRADVEELRRDEVAFAVPYDTSLDISKLKSLSL
jgi:dTDP-4-dehydrorhamnose reductase